MPVILDGTEISANRTIGAATIKVETATIVWTGTSYTHPLQMFGEAKLKADGSYDTNNSSPAHIVSYRADLT